ATTGSPSDASDTWLSNPCTTETTLDTPNPTAEVSPSPLFLPAPSPVIGLSAISQHHSSAVGSSRKRKVDTSLHQVDASADELLCDTSKRPRVRSPSPETLPVTHSVITQSDLHRLEDRLFALLGGKDVLAASVDGRLTAQNEILSRINARVQSLPTAVVTHQELAVFEAKMRQQIDLAIVPLREKIDHIFAQMPVLAPQPAKGKKTRT
ncbi:hypothetical protein OF83DRAFT_1176285, partial [Amylostereum chailletii]